VAGFIAARCRPAVVTGGTATTRALDSTDPNCLNRPKLEALADAGAFARRERREIRLVFYVTKSACGARSFCGMVASTRS